MAAGHLPRWHTATGVVADLVRGRSRHRHDHDGVPRRAGIPDADPRGPAYRVTGLDDSSPSVADWNRARNDTYRDGRFDQGKVDAYFTQWHHRFDLFDSDRPWRQEPRLATECDGPAGLNSLVVTRPSGNNSTLFSPYHDANPGTATIAEAVEYLLIAAFYGSLGRCQARAVNGSRSANFTYLGPVRARTSYHPFAPTTFGTFLAHLVPPAAIDLDPASGTPDLAEWETDLLPNAASVKPGPAGIVSLLANDSGHAILLVPDANGHSVTDAYVTWRFSDKSAGNVLGWDPYLSYKPAPKGPVARVSDTGRDMWRDLPAMLTSPTNPPPAADFQPPLVVASLRALPIAELATLRMAAHSYAQHAFQPTSKDWLTSMSPAVFVALAANAADATAHRYGPAVTEWVTAAEAEALTLRTALYRALRDARNLDPKGEQVKAWQRAATPGYWQDAYAVFDQSLASAVDGGAFEATAAYAPALLREITVRLYDTTTSAVREPRGLLAVAEHRPRPLTRRPMALGISGTPGTPVTTTTPGKDTA